MDKFSFAESVAADFAKNRRYASLRSDATFLDFLMQLFEKLMPLLDGCFMNPKETAEQAQGNSIMGRLRRARLSREIRDELDDEGLSAELTTPLVASILKVVAAS